MSLFDYLEEQMTQEKERIHQSEEQKLQKLKQQYEQQIAELQRTYDYEVEQEIQTRVNREQFVRSRDSKFSTLSQTQTQVQNAYENFVPELVQSDWFATQLKEFLSGTPQQSELTVYGQYKDTLSDILAPQVSGVIQTNDSFELGRIVCENTHKQWELSLDDLLQNLKEQTLPHIKDELGL